MDFLFHRVYKAKDGEAYLAITGKIKRIDDYILQNGEKLYIDDAVNTNGGIFDRPV